MYQKLPFGIFISCLVFSVLFSLPGFSNNLVVSNVSLTGQNTTEKYTYIRFDISWENSWRTSGQDPLLAPNNWDAAWIFAKYRVGSGTWNHVTLSSSGHIAPAGSVISAPTDNVGVFLYRDADGSGTFSKTGVKLRWDYGAMGIGDNDQVEVKVFGIEMVYVLQGPFKIGGTIGSTESGRFYTYPDEYSPYHITSEDEITVGEVTGNLFYLPSSPPGPPDPTIIAGDNKGPIPAAFPKGYNAFYVMKHEVPHHAYVDFLNCLTRDQQNKRTQTDLKEGNTIAEFTLVMVYRDSPPYYTSLPERRSAIRCNSVIPAHGPITFYCDLNNNGVSNEEDDGQHIACIYPSWSDAMAYLDWTGLRPMTELEFEKACRGSLDPVANEFAWGNNTISTATNLDVNAGTANETSSNTLANATARPSSILAPTRTGMYAKPGNNRVQSGATYYGVLDMTGNLWERPVTVGNAIGREYTGKHGDGTITPDGNANVTNWPSLGGEGSGYRGGYWFNSGEGVLRIAGRQYAAQYSDRRRERYGIRGVRTAP